MLTAEYQSAMSDVYSEGSKMRLALHSNAQSLHSLQLTCKCGAINTTFVTIKLQLLNRLSQLIVEVILDEISVRRAAIVQPYPRRGYSYYPRRL